ncbi:hypothetical protein N2K95_04985 [Arthrobacter zhaoxinii]|uniref:Uncharacterized protein n=1 Tax=Arthrobacter zhaoxinii TaxID=2964616 RepID=A0ABY5YVL4_9MICC|nr:hypothetical protein [Arthrobacter zhaoxinii]UWX98029.1 hypothetical protein N2K95_04985 [Arthrobacter zhaoxinii]
MVRDDEQGTSLPAKNRPTETFPNGMRIPQYYGVWRGEWFSAVLTRETATLASYGLEPPGSEWSPSRQTDESGHPWYWMLEVPREALDRLVDVRVTATWRGFDCYLGGYNNGIVHARVGGNGNQTARIMRGEIPEIVQMDRIEYVGTFRWEDLEDIRMEEKDLKK